MYDEATYVTNDAFCLTDIAPIVTVDYLRCYLADIVDYKLRKRSQSRELSIKRLGNILVLIPPIAAQQNIVAYLADGAEMNQLPRELEAIQDLVRQNDQDITYWVNKRRGRTFILPCIAVIITGIAITGYLAAHGHRIMELMHGISDSVIHDFWAVVNNHTHTIY